MGEMKSYQVTSRIRFSGKVYRPGGDPIVLTDADAARLAKLGCIDLVPVPDAAATRKKEAEKASKGA